MHLFHHRQVAIQQETLTKQYQRIIRHLKKDMPSEESEKRQYLHKIFDIVTRRLTFVHLKLNDASSATKIFERLNFRGVKVGIVDLVRNEVFSDVAEKPAEAQRIYDHIWQPFEDEFHGRAEAFFFPYCLIHDSNTKKSELFSQLREMWNNLSPEEIVSHMVPYQLPFLCVDSLGEFPDSSKISLRLERLVRMKRPSSTYPYIINILVAFKKEEISEDVCLGMFDSLESFLVRRAILGYEPTGLHALFKGLWDDLTDYSSDSLSNVVSGKPTIQWPSDGEIKEAIRTRPLAKSRICNYLLVEYDRSLPGDNPNSEPTIEHILPQSYNEESGWAPLFNRDEHKIIKDTLANLIPLSSPLNSSLQASTYDIKQPRYRNESMYKTPRKVADHWGEWTLESINERAECLADWAVTRWPHC